MPEGDTVHKLARALSAECVGRPLDGVWLRDRGELAPLVGRRVREVAPLGKHMLIAAGDHVLHVHLGMHGRWDRYRRGESWRRPAGLASLRLELGGLVYVCFRAAVADLLRRSEVAHHPRLARLGPDLLVQPVPFERIVARARRREPRSAAELLLDQVTACGLGNVYKSEVLFLEGVHPRTPVSALSDAGLEALFRRGAELMSWNLGGWRRTTVRRLEPGRVPPDLDPRLHVYGRAGESCLRCRSGIRCERIGDDARPTWWCPRCQPCVEIGPGGRADDAPARRSSHRPGRASLT